MSQKKKSDGTAVLAVFIIILLVAVIITLAVVKSFDAANQVEPGERSDVWFYTFIKTCLTSALHLILLVCALYVQIIFHEGGHLIFGLLSGYRFVSFRVGSRMLMKNGRGLRFYRYELPGTAGQCLLAPPEKNEDGAFPVLWYNLGGVIFNLLLSVGGVLLLVFVPMPNFIKAFLGALVGFGVYTFLTNGIPMKIGMIANDGYNAFSLSKDKNAANALWTELKINELQSDGIRLKDMPDDLFALPDDADRQNYLISATEVFKENRLMDQKDFESVKTQIELLLSDNVRLLPIYEGLVKIDRLCIDMIENGKNADFSALDDNAVQTVMTMMASSPFVKRCNYFLALYHENNLGKANGCRYALESMKNTYPYTGDLESELELINLPTND